MTFSWIRPLIAESLFPLIVGYAAWTVQGWHKDKAIAELKQGIAERRFKAARELIMANTRIRVLELELQADIGKRNAQLKTANEHAKQIHDRRLADIHSGAIRLSIPTATCAKRPTSEHPGAAGRDRYEARAELDPATASTLETIAGAGDDAIRQLNACIDTYNAMREKCNVQAR